jgi:ferric-dicitrate binding protein FerR (iron transport regulator)
MDISNTRLKELLNKYLEGAASDDEIRQVDDWYRSFESHAGLTEQLNADQRTALEQLLFLRISRQAGLDQPSAKVVKAPFRIWWAAAGIVLLLAAAGMYFFLNQKGVHKEQPVMITEAANKGSIKKIVLPDGSTIWLNFDSKLRYAQQHDREVWLDGEGYFEIAPLADKQFLVHAGKLDVQVLGTSFNVDAYAPGESIMVTVASGKVAIGNKEQEAVTLTANQEAVYKPDLGKIEKYDVGAIDASAWKEGILVFKNASFRSIARKLERRFDVRIRFDGSRTANALLSARFDKDQSLKDILRMLCDIYGFNYRQETGSNEYLIYDDQPHQ